MRRRDALQLLGVGVVGWGISQALRATAPIGTEVEGNPIAQAALVDAEVPSFGPDGADLTLAVYSDYLCPICRVSDAALMAAAREDGGVRILFKDWPILSDASTRAARVALAAHVQGIYERVHAALMRERRTLDDQVLRSAVEGSGGSWARTMRDLETDATAIDRRLARNRMEAFGLGLSGTPGFLVGGLLVNRSLNQAGFAGALARARSIA